MDIKNEVLYRVYILLFAGFVPVAALLVYRTFEIAITEGERWRSEGERVWLKQRVIEPERGSILAADGSLLSTSVPYFDLYFDPYAPSEEDYFTNLDTLAHCMATQVSKAYTPGAYATYLRRLRNPQYNKKREILLKKKVPFDEVYKIQRFPLFNLGRNGGGLIVKKSSERKRPFGMLASRTIGYRRADKEASVGLERRFDAVLRGTPGSQYMVKVDARRDLWLPSTDLTGVEPRSGDDVVTTLDVNLQDIAHSALLRALQAHEAAWGTAILMDVKTGAIKAIANLGRSNSGGGYFENYNYAVGTATESGSTFKTASMLALLEDGFVRLTDSVSISYGRATFHGQTMLDVSDYSRSRDSISVRQAFEHSSNVGVSRLVNQYYGRKTEANGMQGAARYISHLQNFMLHLPTGIELDGEVNPYIKEAYSEKHNWSGTTLPWMSIGYESQLTPLQLLTFYNAIANNGRLMKPYLVSGIRREGEEIVTYRPTVVKEQIASPRAIRDIRLLLEGVVQRGTARNLATDRYRFAGKTGTTQIEYQRTADGTQIGGYQASFAGYFPAHNPVYSCLVVINKPRSGAYYGSDVAGPVFREIADKAYSILLDAHEAVNQGPRPVLYAANLPRNEVGFRTDFEEVLRHLGLAATAASSSEMVLLTADSDSLLLRPRRMPHQIVPSVQGMGLRDATYILENRGLKVRSVGVGRVDRQSLPPGSRIRGQTIVLYLR